VGVAVRWQLAPSHPLTLREKAHALFYPKFSLFLFLFLLHSVTNSLLTSRSFSSSSPSSKRVLRSSNSLRSSDAFPPGLTLIFHPLLLFAHIPDYPRRTDVNLTPSSLRVSTLSSLLHSRLMYPFSDVYIVLSSSITSLLCNKAISLVLSLYHVSIISHSPRLSHA